MKSRFLLYIFNEGPETNFQDILGLEKTNQMTIYLVMKKRKIEEEREQ